MWWPGGSIVALSLILLVCQLIDLLGAPRPDEGEAPPPPPPRRPLQWVSMLLAGGCAVTGTLIALADENLGPWAYGGGYRLLGLATWGAQFAALAIALALWLLARPRAARSKMVKVVIVVSWIVVAGVGVCYGLFVGM